MIASCPSPQYGLSGLDTQRLHPLHQRLARGYNILCRRGHVRRMQTDARAGQQTLLRNYDGIAAIRMQNGGVITRPMKAIGLKTAEILDVLNTFEPVRNAVLHWAG